MAQIFPNIEIEHKTRSCTVGGESGYFHCWEQYADVITPGLTIGSQQGGQFFRVYGIVEFADRVEQVEPFRIKFTDEKNAALSMTKE